MSVFLDSGSEINIIHPAFAEILGLVVQTNNVGAQKIDGTTLETHKIVVAAFSVSDQANMVRFLEKICLVVNVNPDIVFGMLFFTLNSAYIDFLKRKLWWRLYIIEEAFFTNKRSELVGKKEFTAALLDPGYETFVVYIASLENSSSIQEGDVHLSRRVQKAILVANKAPTSISTKYSDFADIFSLELASKLP